MNADMAVKKLEGLNLKIKSYDIGGTLGRRLFFDTSTGDVWVKKLTKHTASIFERKDMQKQKIMQSNLQL